MNFNSYTSLATLFIIPVLFCFVLFCFWTRNCIYYTSVSCVWFLLPCVSLQSNRVWKYPKQSDPTFWFLFDDFRLCSRYNNINYGAWHVYKPLFGSSVAICRFACSEISLSIKEKKLEKSLRKGLTWYNLADGVTTLAQLYALYSHGARSFNQWQNFIFIVQSTVLYKDFQPWEKP